MDLTNHSNTALTFTENHHGITVLSRLYEQLAESKYCDVVLHVKGQSYSAHRCVLASCSPYFETAFKESTKSKDHLSINSQHLETFETVFMYMYTGKIIIDFDTVTEILRLGNYLMLRELKGYCIAYLERSLQINNVYFILDMAEKWNLEPLSKNVHAFLMANLLEVVEQNEILHFDEYRMEGFISNKSYPLMEDVKIHIICKWVMEDLVGRHLAFQRLMSQILWARLNVQTLYNMIQSERLFTESEYCMWYLLKVLQEKNLLLEMYSQTLTFLEKKVEAGQSKEQILLSQRKQEEMKESKDASISEHMVDHTDSVEELDEPKLLLVDQSMTDKGNLIIDEDSDDIPLDYTSDPDVELMKNTKQQEDSEMERTMKSTVEISKLNSIDVLDTQNIVAGVKELKKESVEAEKESILDVEREKHKRKGQPVKLRIPRSRLKMTGGSSAPKRRGRPLKNVESSKMSLRKRGRHKKNELPMLDTVPLKGVKQESVSTQQEYVAPSDGDVVGNRVDDSDTDQTYAPPKLSQRKKSKIKRIPLHKKMAGRRRKKVKQEKASVSLYQCEHCTVKCEDDTSLVDHIQTNHPDATNYACSKCGFSTLWNREYYKHMKTHFSGPPYMCDYEGCDHVTERIQPLIYHRMRHTDERPFLCTTCNMKFRTKNNLATHTRCHTGEKPWHCEICDRSFATKGTLEQHSVTHSASRPYLCDTCGFSTKYQSHLIAHKRIHTGDVFRCQYPNCKYSTPKRSQLACHMRSHMSIRQHICAVCSRAFVEKSHLVRHERIHLEDKPFKCPECDYSSTRRDKLKEHTNKYHSDTIVKSQYKPRKPRKQSFDPQAFPDYSHEGAIRVQEEFDGQMQKSVQQRNQLHAHMQEIKPQNKQSIVTGETPSAAATSLSSELTQLKNVLLSAEAQGQGANPSNLQTNANHQVVPVGVTYSDSMTPMVIEPNSATGNILLSNVAFALDSRNLGFVQTPGNATTNATMPATGHSAAAVASALQALPQIGLPHDNGNLNAMVSYANLGIGGTAGLPIITLSGAQTVHTATTDLSQLPPLSGNFY